MFSVMIYVRFTDILKHLILSVFTRTVLKEQYQRRHHQVSQEEDYSSS